MSSFNIVQRSQSLPNLAEIQKTVEASKTQQSQQSQQIQQTKSTDPSSQTGALNQARPPVQSEPKKDTGFTPENFQQLIMSKSMDTLQQQVSQIDQVPELKGLLEELCSETLTAST